MNLQELFTAALEIEDRQQRARFVARSCGGDQQLRLQLQNLLAAHEQSGDFLKVPALKQVAGERAAETRAPAGHPGHDVSLEFLQPSNYPGAIGRLQHYEVLEVIGHGGCGIVLKAFDKRLHRVVAVKTMTPELAATSPARKRFLREARATAAVRHENVVSIYAVEESPLPFLVMEFVDGLTLQDKITQSGPLSIAEIVTIGRQLARGLEAAHAQGLIHRDIKPTNILLEQGSERAKITDFGLARSVDDASLTQSGAISGTPLYMSPEQAQGHRVDARTDLFSLGSVLYFMCTGRPPFRAATAIAVMKRVVEEQPRGIAEIIPETPDWLIQLITRLHAKNPTQRIGTAHDVAEILEHGSIDRNTASEAGPQTPIPVTISSSPNASSKKTSRRYWLTTVGAIGLLLMVLGLALMPIVWSLSRTRPPTAEHSEPPTLTSQPKAEPQPRPTIAAAAVAEPLTDPITGRWAAYIGPPQWPATLEIFDDQTGVIHIESAVIAAMKQRSGVDRSLYQSLPISWSHAPDGTYELTLIGGEIFPGIRIASDRMIISEGHRSWEKQSGNGAPSPWARSAPIVGLWQLQWEETETVPEVIDFLWDGTTQKVDVNGVSIASSLTWRLQGPSGYVLLRPGQEPMEVTIAATQLVSRADNRAIGQHLTRTPVKVDRRPVHSGRLGWRGDYQVQGNEFVQTKTGHSKLVFGSPAWADFDLHVDMQTLSGRESGHIVFRCARDAHNFYILYLRDADGKAAFLKSVQEKKQLLAPQIPLGVVNNRWYHVHIQARGSALRVAVDNRPVFAVVDNTFQRGYLGFNTFGSSAKWKDLRLTAPDGTSLWEGFPDISE